ncbi:hypothetical protein [Micromonospora tulbaghiae]|uniref:hypothetical protein n=1 Tax=Micromonospora tulbaghiae TaxID=479978 RepID=UPI0033C42F74
MNGIRRAVTMLAVLAALAGFALIVAYLATDGHINPHPVTALGLTLPVGFLLAAAAVIALAVSGPTRRVP